MPAIRINNTLYTDIDLIIFDKDGTLIDLHATWAPQVRRWGRQLQALPGLRHASLPDFYRQLGFDPHSGTLLPEGPLAVAPLPPLIALTAGFIYRHEIPWPAALAQATALLQVDLDELVRDTVPLGPVADTLGRLAGGGVRLAIATNDDRAPTLAALPALQIAPLIAALVCGDDPLPPKPDPAGFHQICRRLQIAPARALMVGDSSSDIACGRQAGAAACIGIGRPGAPALAGADEIIPTIAALQLHAP